MASCHWWRWWRAGKRRHQHPHSSCPAAKGGRTGRMGERFGIGAS